MEAVFINKSFSDSLSLDKVVTAFFKENTPDSTKITFLKILQCWALNDCHLRAEISHEEIALFMDQLMDLVAAAYILHEANRATKTGQEGKEHD